MEEFRTQNFVFWSFGCVEIHMPENRWNFLKSCLSGTLGDSRVYFCQLMLRQLYGIAILKIGNILCDSLGWNLLFKKLHWSFCFNSIGLGLLVHIFARIAWIWREVHKSETSQHIFPKLCTHIHKPFSKHLSKTIMIIIMVIKNKNNS